MLGKCPVTCDTLSLSSSSHFLIMGSNVFVVSISEEGTDSSGSGVPSAAFLFPRFTLPFLGLSFCGCRPEVSLIPQVGSGLSVLPDVHKSTLPLGGATRPQTQSPTALRF